MHQGLNAAAIIDVREDPSPFLRLKCLCLQISLSGKNFHIRHGFRAARDLETVDSQIGYFPLRRSLLSG